MCVIDMLRRHLAKLEGVVDLDLEPPYDVMSDGDEYLPYDEEAPYDLNELDGWRELLGDVVQTIQQRVKRRWQKVRNHVTKGRIFWWWYELPARFRTRERDRVVACEECKGRFSFVD